MTSVIAMATGIKAAQRNTSGAAFVIGLTAHHDCRKLFALNYVKPLWSFIFINYICNQNLSLNINFITKLLNQ